MEDEHVHPSVRHALTWSDKERIVLLKRKSWIGYRRAREALQKLEELFETPQSHRMPNLMIYGTSNNGKTMIIERFMRDHPANDNPEGDAAEVPAFHMQMPTKAEAKNFYTIVLDKFSAPYRHTDGVSKLESQVLKLMKACGTKILIIDEVHNLIGSRVDQQRQFLNLIRFLGNELRIPIVCAGLKSGLRAIQFDEQLANRFEPFALPLWSNDAEFAKLLNTFVMILPLRKKSPISERSFVEMVFALSEGTIGEAMELMRRAAVHAIHTGQETIDIHALKACGYVPPSERRRMAERGS